MGYLSAALPATDRSQPTMQGSAHLEDTQVACAEGLRACLSEREPDELRRGVTLVGPQRDDLQLMLDGEPAKGYASHGESWSIALALRLACFELLQAEAIDDGAPVLILDDVFAELDAGAPRPTRGSGSYRRADSRSRQQWQPMCQPDSAGGC